MGEFFLKVCKGITADYTCRLTLILEYWMRYNGIIYNGEFD